MTRQQRRAAARRPDRVVAPVDTLNGMVDVYLRRWLPGTEMGRGILARAGSFEEAVSATVELLNLGYLKLIVNRDGFTGIETRSPPEPPTGRIEHLRRH